MENILRNYIDILLKRQNDVEDDSQKNLFSYEEYEDILSKVNDLLMKYPDFDINEYHHILFNNSMIMDYVKELIIDKDYANHFILSYGSNNIKDTITIGDTNKDSLIDLASVTKFFSGITVLDLVNKGMIDLNKTVSFYTDEFPNINNVTIYELLTFNMPLKTNNRIDKMDNYEKAYDELKKIEIDYDFKRRNPYTDMGVIILKYIIEKVTGMTYYDYLNQNILLPLKMENTIVDTNGKKVVPTGNTLYVYNNGIKLTKDNNGKPFDPKAQILKQNPSDLPGHAGLFSTTGDMLLLANALKNGDILDPKLIECMCKNATGGKTILNAPEPMLNYLGMMCYSKNPWISESAIHPSLAGKTLASVGYTGNKFVVDPKNDLSLFMSANRTNEKTLYVENKDLIKEDNGRKYIVYNGKEYTITNRYAWDNSKVFDESVKLMLQYSYLEYIFDLEKEDNLKENITR